MSYSDGEPVTRSMKDWGRYLGGLDYQQTLPEATLHVLMVNADRLGEAVTALQTIGMRLARIEAWIEQRDPGYAKASELAAARVEQATLPEKTNGSR